MLRSKYPEALRVADDASNLFKSNGFIRNQVLQFGFFVAATQIFFVFSFRNPSEDEPIFDVHIFQMGWFNHQPVVFFFKVFSPQS